MQLPNKILGDAKPREIVIIGNGIAGNSAAHAIRSLDKEVRIALISNEMYPLYSPCAFHKYLSGKIERKRLFLKKYEDYLAQGIEPIFGQEVLEVDVENKVVHLPESILAYQNLILATGSNPIVPSVKGADKQGVFVPKKMDDADAIFQYPSRRVVVVGSGPVGIEMSVAFALRGKKVFIVEMFDRVLARLFHKKGADILRRVVEDNGIEVYTGERVAEVLGDLSVGGVKTNKREIECDMVIMAAGVTCNTAFAAKVGINRGSFGGIVTDAYMMTNKSGVYACGDCIESKDIITGKIGLNLLWVNAKRQGLIAGSNSLGKRKRYDGSLNATSLDLFGTYVASAGQIATSEEESADCEIIEKSNDTNYYRLVIMHGKLVGMELITECEHAGHFISKMLRRDDLVKLRRTFLEGKLVSMKPWNYWISRYM